MRIYDDCYELMSEMGRNLWEMGSIVKPKTYQNKVIEGDESYITRELICEQYCLTSLNNVDKLFIYSNSKEWADNEFLERINNEPLNPGGAWTLRKYIWEQFLVNGKFDYTYSERMYGSLRSIINLLKNDPDTRKAVLPIFNGEYNNDCKYYDGSKRIPCSMYYDFLVRENQKGEKVLNICYHQRSSDFVTHFGNDVYLAWKLMEFVANRIGVKAGYLYHTIDSIHSYKKDWILLKTSLNDLRGY